VTSLQDRVVTHDTIESPLIAFQVDLRHVRRSFGDPSYENLVYRSQEMGHYGLSKSTIVRMLNGPKLVGWPAVEEFLRVCGVNTSEIQTWRQRWADTMNLINPLDGSTTVGDDRRMTEGTAPPDGRECSLCGAWVTNGVRHNAWHDMFVPKSDPTKDGRRSNVRRLFGNAAS
jgi:hypothetical protein